jgi:hypothetical protein
MMKKHVLFLTVAVLALVSAWSARCAGQSSLLRRGGREVLEAVTEYLTRKTGREAAEELAEFGGKRAVREIGERVAREGGEEAVEQLARLTRFHGLDAIRAARKVDDMAPVLRSVDNLGDDAAGAALRRLAGESGERLARLTRSYGTRALRAEIKHPGVGTRLVQALGDDGAELAMKLNTDQAVQLARHADEIAELPPARRRGIMALFGQNTKKMLAFTGRFVKDNPGKVLFTGAATGVILAKSDKILGGATIKYDEQGQPHVVQQSGLVGRLVREPLMRILDVLLPIVAVGAAAWFALKLWGVYRSSRPTGQA